MEFENVTFLSVKLNTSQNKFPALRIIATTASKYQKEKKQGPALYPDGAVLTKNKLQQHRFVSVCTTKRKVGEPVHCHSKKTAAFYQ